MTNEIIGVYFHKRWRVSALQRFAERGIQLWDAIARRDFSPLLIIGVWLLVSVPPALCHGYHYVEGLTVTIAQSALDDGNWLTPHLYNLRWIERPTLLSWIIAAMSMPFGHVSPFVARLPIILSLLAGAFLIRNALRRVASAGAAMFGALAFLSSPVVIRYYVTAVADLPLAVILFATFLTWWNSYTTGRISVGRWFGIGCLLAIAALLKGPQPVAYFALGIVAFAALTSTWWQLPGLFLASLLAAVPIGLWYANVFVPGDQGEWLRYTRLSPNGFTEPHPFANAIDFFFESIPATLLVVPLLLTGAKSIGKRVPRHFIMALGCYALTCTFVILFWPAEINPRYILPMVLPLCVLAGIAYDALLERWPTLVAGAISITLGLLGYAAIHSASDGLLTPAYNHSKVDGAQISELVARAQAPVYRIGWDTALNELAYFAHRTTTIDQNAIPTIAKPAWIVVPADAVSAIVARGNGHIKSRLVMDRAVLLRLE
ncbi:MAG: glycosyltransferase family 39 protein [Hyphomicrobium sp.]|uniref:ArnT family glycosyltransferase n=1 Tax=Hyphomicrobium sp. TaxID=82 RepID=UPI0039E600DF